MNLNKFWVTGKGQHILYCDLSDDHFMNIVADGYRNQSILEESIERDIYIPLRKVDLMTPKELDNAAWAVIDKLVEKNGLSNSKRQRMKNGFDLFKKHNYDRYLLLISRAIDGRDDSVGELCIELYI